MGTDMDHWVPTGNRQLSTSSPLLLGRGNRRLMVTHGYRDDYRDRDYRRRSRSRSWDRYEHDRYRHGRDRDYYRRSRSPSASPDYYRSRGRGRYYDDRQSRSPIRSRSIDSASPARRSPTPRRSLSPLSRSGSASPDGRGRDRSPASRSVSPQGRLADSRSPSPRHSDDD